MLDKFRITKDAHLVLSIMLASVVTLSPFAIDTYLAAMPMMAEYFGVKLNIIEFTITLYFLGFAVGNFLGGPLSDSFGRKPIALTGIFLYGVAAIGISFSSSIELILVLRAVQAFGGGFATVTANVFVRDWYSGKEVARFITIISMMMMLAPLFAPVIGAFLIHFNGWQAVFYFLAAFAAILFIAFAVVIPESRDKDLITNKISGQQIISRYKAFFADTQSVIFLFSISFSMAGLYVFLTSASFIYIDYFQVKNEQFPILFGSNVVLNILLSLLNTFLLKKYTPSQILKTGLLLQLLSGASLFFAVLFSEPSFWVVFGSIVLFIGSLGLVFGNGSAIILNYNPKVSASANATIGIARFVLSFLIGSIMALFHTETLIPVGTAMFSCSMLGNLLFAWAVRYKNQ